LEVLECTMLSQKNEKKRLIEIESSSELCVDAPELRPVNRGRVVRLSVSSVVDGESHVEVLLILRGFARVASSGVHCRCLRIPAIRRGSERSFAPPLSRG
jgi:hypothetical protein